MHKFWTNSKDFEILDNNTLVGILFFLSRKVLSTRIGAAHLRVPVSVLDWSVHGIVS